MTVEICIMNTCQLIKENNKNDESCNFFDKKKSEWNLSEFFRLIGAFEDHFLICLAFFPVSREFIVNINGNSLHFLKITYTIAAETCYSRMFILWILSCTFSFMHAIHIISIDQIFFGFAFSIWLVIFSQWINFLYLSRMAAICSFCLRTFSHCAPNTVAVEVFADHARTPGI